MSQPETSGSNQPDGPADSLHAWFCVRSQPRHEHIAARQLRQMEQIEVFSPRIRFARPTRQGPIWVTESLFPNYLFVRFNWKLSLTRVHYAPGVAGIVHFGSRWPTIPGEIIQEMRDTLGPQEIHIVSKEFSPGDKVQVAGGIFHGLEAIITQVMPGRQRVTILMDFLGRQTAMEVGAETIVKRGLK